MLFKDNIVGTMNQEAIWESFSEEEREYLGKSLKDFIPQRRPRPDLFAWAEDLQKAFDIQRKAGLNVFARVMCSSPGARALVEDPITGEKKEMIMLGSNSYLGLNNHPRVIKAVLSAIEKYGVGSGSPPHFSGYYETHRALEENLAWLKGGEDAAVFPSGYSTNVGILSCFLTPKDIVILDRLAHASIIDGAILSRAKIMTFKHNDLDSLERVLKETKDYKDGDRLVVVEGVYSMDGDITPLPEVLSLVRKYGAKLMLDEAHATGVLGKTGKGTLEHFGLEGEVDIVMGTFSKALGGVGGFVVSKKPVITYLRMFARSYMFAASPPPHVVAGLNEAVNVLKEEPIWHKKLWENIRYFQGELKRRGFNIGNPESAVTPLIIGDTTKLFLTAGFLHKKGIFVNPVPYPAVPRGGDRLRLSVSALHTKEDLDKAIEALEEAHSLYQIKPS